MMMTMMTMTMMMMMMMMMMMVMITTMMTKTTMMIFVLKLLKTHTTFGYICHGYTFLIGHKAQNCKDDKASKYASTTVDNWD